MRGTLLVMKGTKSGCMIQDIVMLNLEHYRHHKRIIILYSDGWKESMAHHKQATIFAIVSYHLKINITIDALVIKINITIISLLFYKQSLITVRKNLFYFN